MRPAVIAVPLALLCIASAFAQTGTLAGTVLEPTGNPAAEASVQARNTQTGATVKATSSRDGHYSVSLPAGSWDVSFSLAGWQGVNKRGIAVAASKATTLDARLEETTQLNTLGEDGLHTIADLKLHHPPSGPTPRTADGKPDFSGVWWAPVTTDPGKPEWTPWAEQIGRERTENNRRDSPKSRCLPSTLTFSGAVWQFVQSRDFLIHISDDDFPGFYQIYLNREHEKDPNPAWYGNNVARWDGDTLVVDRIAFDDRDWLDGANHPVSSQLHIVEKYRRPDLGHLEIEATFEDPKVVAKPFTQKRTAELAPDQKVFEFMCTENNVDVPHLVGK